MGRTLFQGRICDGLYPIQLPLPASSHSPSALHTVRLGSSVWHHRLGHPAPPIMAGLSRQLSLSGSSKLSSVCSSCQMGKSSRLPFSVFMLLFSFRFRVLEEVCSVPTYAYAFSLCLLRVCGNPHAIIRKYGLMCCRQCFRSNAKEIGTAEEGNPGAMQALEEAG
ncbi:hypothetical protein HHK36_008240 [Tetracentron sinense]|uniref:GAG-pre-integrase domain-containing protein n=1 Tax=Tetracentron sinense TaxID=13715 RepID=A0A834ZF67_TETSI|nr:hypothetical protein HHK36_008240 [Tetracentron sinense]